MKKYDIQIDNSRDELFTDFGSEVLKDRYLLEGETQQELFKRVALAYSDNEEHAQRIYDYISKMWFMPATPILANGGTNRGLPISCFLNEMQDSLDSIAKTWNENVYLASSGGGIGTHIGNIRSINEEIAQRGQTTGVIPFIKVVDSMTLAISQGALRRGSAAVYMQDTHPEIEEFLDIRRPTGDTNRRCLNIHHGVCVSDEFMQAVEKGAMWDLKSPKTGKVLSTTSARNLWIKLLASRVETGEPYILFTGNVQKNKSKVYQALEKEYGLKVKTSNLCVEIMLQTGFDQHKKERTAVCCLSSLNLEYYEEWKNNELFIEDVARFLDNVLTDFIDKAPDAMERAKYSSMRERSIGIGVMGFHSFLQSKKTPFASVSAKSWNKTIFKHINEKCDIANEKLANEKGACPDALELGINRRFANTCAIAPTASISIIAGNSSPGIEPYAANCYTHKTLSGAFIVRNRHLKKLLQEKGHDSDAVWSSIALNEGSVQHLDFLNQDEKDVFKTAMEIDQMWIVQHAADRQPFIDQGQSTNLFFASNVEKRVLHDIHFAAWKKGVKSLYYCRSSSIQRAEKPEDKFSKEQEKAKEVVIPTQPEYDECLACQ
jgi:ribonucleoside-diphosphate reductase alpha chain